MGKLVLAFWFLIFGVFFVMYRLSSKGTGGKGKGEEGHGGHSKETGC